MFFFNPVADDFSLVKNGFFRKEVFLRVNGNEYLVKNMEFSDTLSPADLLSSFVTDSSDEVQASL